jgi:hypothetical protein
VNRIFIHPHLLRAVAEEEARAVLEDVICLVAAPGASVQLSNYFDLFDEFQKGLYLRGANLAGWKLAGMLLALVPNLERLSLQVKDPGGVPGAAFTAVQKALGSPALVLSKIKTLDLCPRSEGWWAFDLDHQANGIVEAIAAYKGCLSTLNLHGFSSCTIRSAELLPSLQTLRISNSRSNNASLAAWLRFRGGPGLRAFFYEAKSVSTDSWFDNGELACSFLFPLLP